MVDKELLDALTEEAKRSPRLRMNRDMRTQSLCPELGHEDASQRMLNALEPGTVVPVHRHPMSTETVCVLRGAVRQSFYEEVDNNLKLVEDIVVEAGSLCPMYVVPAGMWHTTEALVSGTIIFEAKDGRYGEDGSESWG